jgi:hypothetical protein
MLWAMLAVASKAERVSGFFRASYSALLMPLSTALGVWHVVSERRDFGAVKVRAA